ncbi:MAG: DUF2934 domain-containing protein [Rhodocyclaceae bacterium]|nr:MAG: DUF2934 domain-containing protein [Rhodocyclaceae bacterium]
MKSTEPKRKVSDGSEPSEMTAQEVALSSSVVVGHIATAAYYKAATRSFAPGRELDDWLEAEAEFLK